MPFCFVPDHSFTACHEKPRIFKDTIDFNNTSPLRTNMNYCSNDDRMKNYVKKACEHDCVVRQIATPVPSKYHCDKISKNDVYRFLHECDSRYCKQECAPSDRRCIKQCPIDCERIKVCSSNYNLPHNCRISICQDSAYVSSAPAGLKPGTEYATSLNQFCYHYDTMAKKWVYKAN